VGVVNICKKLYIWYNTKRKEVKMGKGLILMILLAVVFWGGGCVPADAPPILPVPEVSEETSTLDSRLTYEPNREKDPDQLNKQKS
jgi:hypothetical protein